MSTSLHHPVFQSLVLPVLLSLLSLSALSALSARPAARWAPLGAALGLLGALAWLPGFDWPAASRVQKLPWIVLAGLLLSVAVMTPHRSEPSPWRTGLGALLGWTGTCVWLLGPGASLLLALGIGLAGAAVLGLLAWGQQAAPAAPGGAVGASSLTVAALGLAALAGHGGSLLLAQLALMVATCSAVLGGWLWRRPPSGVQAGFAALMPLSLAWLALAVSMGDTARLGLLALAFAVPPLLTRKRWAQIHPRWMPLVAALLAALPVAAAVVWPFNAGVVASPGTLGDDPYYTPGWAP